MNSTGTEPSSWRLIQANLEDWKFYPQRQFLDWTPDRVRKSGMLFDYGHMEPCTVHVVDLLDGGGSEQESISHVNGIEESMAACWNRLQTLCAQRNEQQPPSRVRAIFVENIAFQVLQMLGTMHVQHCSVVLQHSQVTPRYNIEPSFFLSSANQVPSSYQDDLRPREGDRESKVSPTLSLLPYSYF